MTRCRRSFQRTRRFLAYASTATLLIAPSCFSSDIAKRFREGYGPAAVQGLSTYLTDPENAEAGLQQAGAALFDGIGAILQPRTGSSTSNN